MGWRRLLLVTALLAAVVASCGEGSEGATAPAGQPWGAEAQAWMDGLVASAERQGGIGMAPFSAERVVLDARTINFARRPFVGWEDVYLNYWRHVFYEGEDVWTEDFPVFVDVEGAATVGTYVDPTPGGGAAIYTAMVLVLEIGPDGVRNQIPTFSTSTLSDIDSPAAMTGGAEAVAEAWTRAWTTGDPAELTGLYDPSVQVVDSVGRLLLVGIDDVLARGRLAGEVTWSVAETSLAEPAVYPYSVEWGRLDGVLLVAAGDGGPGGGVSDGGVSDGVSGGRVSGDGACPGHQAIWLELDPDTGLVVAERRFWSVDDARRCNDSTALPDGWWTGRPLPGPAAAPFEDLERVTLRYTVGGRTVEIHNGTPTLEALVQWAVSRYDQAGMAPPLFDSVTFSRFSEYCEDVDGRTIPVVGEALDPAETDPPIVGWDLFLCFDESRLCTDPSCSRFQTGPKRTMLHELAHVWVAENLDDPVRDQFMDLVGVDTWSDHSLPWAERGTEWASETIAWGLLDVSYQSTALGRPSDETMEVGFRLLTGVQPIRPDR